MNVRNVMENKRYVLCGSDGPWLDFAYECNTIEDAERLAARVLHQGQVAGIWDTVENRFIMDLTLRYDGLGLS